MENINQQPNQPPVPVIPPTAEPPKKGSLPIVGLSIILIIMSASGTYWYLRKNEQTPPVINQEKPETILESIKDKNKLSDPVYYTLSPDESKIFYVNDFKRTQPVTYCAGESEKFEFYDLDPKTKNPTKIHEINFDEDYSPCQESPYIYWIDQKRALIGAQIYLGLCDPRVKTSSQLYDMDAKKLSTVNCVTQGRTQEKFDYIAQVSYLSNYIKEHKAKVYKINYKCNYCDTSFLVLDNDYAFLFGRYVSSFNDPPILEVENLYTELNKIAQPLLQEDELIQKQFQQYRY